MVKNSTPKIKPIVKTTDNYMSKLSLLVMSRILLQERLICQKLKGTKYEVEKCRNNCESKNVEDQFQCEL